jgi:CMP-N,N'-diacetyllegionaminic acid synthase
MGDLHSLIVIPARGGSKGIPRKNLIEVGGKPLLAWSIQSAKNCTSPNVTAVSTDDPEIGGLASVLGAHFVERPDQLATDTSSTEETMLHTLETLSSTHSFTHVVLLQPTCPIRRRFLVDEAFRQLLDDQSDSLVGVVRESPFLWKGPISDGSPSYNIANRPMRQSFTEQDFTYRETGNIYITSVKALLTNRIRTSGKTSLFILNDDEGIDIDTMADVKRAQSILEATAQ